MAIKKSKSGFVFHVIITLVGVAVAFFVGFKVAGAGQGDAQKVVAQLRSDIDANATLIKGNKKQVDSSLRKINSLNSSVLRDLKITKAGLVSAGKGMTYVNKVLGLKWVVRRDDGHRYCLIPYPLPWHYAQDFASKVGGSLVVIDDEKENKWITDTFGSKTEFWIGLTDQEDESKWLWVNDLDLIYANWATGEPDNYRQTQHHVIMNKQAAKGQMQAGKWNDIAGNEIKIGIIEVSR